MAIAGVAGVVGVGGVGGVGGVDAYVCYGRQRDETVVNRHNR